MYSVGIVGKGETISMKDLILIRLQNPTVVAGPLPYTSSELFDEEDIVECFDVQHVKLPTLEELLRDPEVDFHKHMDSLPTLTKERFNDGEVGIHLRYADTRKYAHIDTNSEVCIVGNATIPDLVFDIEKFAYKDTCYELLHESLAGVPTKHKFSKGRQQSPKEFGMNRGKSRRDIYGKR